MKQVRIGIVGLGNMGRYHADYLLNNKVERCVLGAVADASPANLERYQAKNLPAFTDACQMIRSGQIDAILIATPHFLHTSLGMDAFQNGLHVLVEKPISVHKADCERLIAAHQAGKNLVFGAMFQSRTEQKWKKIKRLVEGGELGKIVRANWIVTDWYRTEIYYASGGWRATWKGEGGGVLLNQCPHNLDILLWLCGKPARVRGFCQIGRYHNIEVEDNVTAYLEFPGGATGSFITSTGETPGTNRFELTGERGKVVLENNKITFTRNEVSMLEFSQTSKAGFARPDIWNIEIPHDGVSGKHEEIVQNFVNAILDGSPLIAPGAQGMDSVELANAILYSSFLNQTIEMPLDGQAYEAKLNQLIAESKFEKKVVAPVTEDFTKSFSGSR